MRDERDAGVLFVNPGMPGSGGWYRLAPGLPSVTHHRKEAKTQRTARCHPERSEGSSSSRERGLSVGTMRILRLPAQDDLYRDDEDPSLRRWRSSRAGACRLRMTPAPDGSG